MFSRFDTIPACDGQTADGRTDVLQPIAITCFSIADARKNWILKFADDTKIFTRTEDDNDRKALQNDLSKLIRGPTWSEKWQMLFNISKCKVMHIGKTQKQFPYYRPMSN